MTRKTLALAVTLAATALAAALPARAQTPAPTAPPVATDITAADVRAFLDALPRDRVSDLPIRVVGVTGDYRVGVFGVFRPKSIPGDANLHRVNTTEIYYMLSGEATLVTGGTMVEAYEPTPGATSLRAPRVEGGVTRQVVPGDIVIIPGHTPHWWSALNSDIEYLIFRPDPDNRMGLR
jgi:mannose-6-phosphate isomerase-like protein (cupin superfamily)